MRTINGLAALWLSLAPLALLAQAQAPLPGLLTRAEQSDYAATSSYVDVTAFCQALARQSNHVQYTNFGLSGEGRKLPLLILSQSGIGSAGQARAAGRPVILCVGNIHAGEVCGKEALLMLARELARIESSPVLKEYVVLMAPLLNADGNERVSKEHRPHQLGPSAGVGQRANAAGLDLNRDFVKLEAPETRGLVRLIRQWDPVMVIDTHTTDGSRHRYQLTFEGPGHPASDPGLVRYVREHFLPEVRKRLETSGIDTFFYGNFNADHTRWETYPAWPRYGVHYLGLRHCLAILSEAYVYLPFKERVAATRAFVGECLEMAAREKKEILALVKHAEEQAARGASQAQVPIRTRLAPLDAPVVVKGWVEATNQSQAAHDYSVSHWARSVPVKSVELPYAYLLPGNCSAVLTNLQRHGIEVLELREDLELEVERYRVEKEAPAESEFQNHHLLSLAATVAKAKQWFPAGTFVVKTAQKTGRLAACLLEPEAEDGLAAWNFFAVREQENFPVCRLMRPTPLLTVAARLLPEDRTFNRAITFDTVYGDKAVNFSGSPTRVDAWLKDGKQFLQVREGRLHQVDAATGRARLLLSSNAVFQVLRKLSGLDEKTVAAICRRTRFDLNPERTGALFEHDHDLYFLRFDGSTAVRLTRTSEPEELPSFSPDGRLVAFVRSDNLYVVDLATQTERALTTDGNGLLRNGKADWVYFEEINNRDWKAYWWSPDSKRVAFEQFDDETLPTFHALNTLPLHGKVESMRHPKAGDANPTVRLGVVSAAGGPIQWMDDREYPAGSFVISGVGWMPQSAGLYCYVQDRTQTWLDFRVWHLREGRTERFYRDHSPAWLESPGDPQFLAQGDFILPRDSTGWNHLYRFNTKTRDWTALTAGEWEVRKLHAVDERAGWIYFSGTRDSPIAENLYRCRLDGSGLERITSGAGHHRVTIDPTARWFIDSASDYRTPERVRLCRTDGALVRTLDANPVFAREEFQWGDARLLQIPGRDGFLYEAGLVYPVDFTASERYPVWLLTYGGPRMPTIRNAWSGGRAQDQMLANLGMVVLHVDPRSASGKGSAAAWTAYRQLGVQELKDLTDALGWLKRQPFIDPAHIGMSGHSYGGFLTAFALTHSDLFAAGIAGSPVTDWRFYDSIYTERYMDLPENNPAGYAASSVVKAASQLHGRLLLLHGMLDDNVHLQNATRFIDELQKAGKEFEVMFYPEMRHGLYGAHYHRQIVQFIQRALDLKPRAALTATAP